MALVQNDFSQLSYELTNKICEKCKHDYAYHKFHGRVCIFKVDETAEFPYCDCKLGYRIGSDQLP